MPVSQLLMIWQAILYTPDSLASKLSANLEYMCDTLLRNSYHVEEVPLEGIKEEQPVHMAWPTMLAKFCMITCIHMVSDAMKTKLSKLCSIRDGADEALIRISSFQQFLFSLNRTLIPFQWHLIAGGDCVLMSRSACCQWFSCGTWSSPKTAGTRGTSSLELSVRKWVPSSLASCLVVACQTSHSCDFTVISSNQIMWRLCLLGILRNKIECLHKFTSSEQTLSVMNFVLFRSALRLPKNQILSQIDSY